jgi:hypothetical protein
METGTPSAITYVKNIGAFGHLASSLRDGCLRFEKAAAGKKRIRRHIDDAHDEGPPFREKLRQHVVGRISRQ